MASTTNILRAHFPLKGSAKVAWEDWNEAEDRVEGINEIDEPPHPDLTTLLEAFIPVCRSYMDLGSSWDDAVITEVKFQADVDTYHMAFTLQQVAEGDKRKLPTGKIDGSILDQSHIRALEQELLLYLKGKKRKHTQLDIFTVDAEPVNDVAEAIVQSTMSKARKRNQQKCTDDYCPVAS